jgi:glycerophosphoryl diester phosphodiesterase
MKASDYPFFDAGFLAFAHRGGATYPANVGRENTRYAFEQAVDLGYRYLETDVHATADGQLVAFHDTHLDRVTDRSGAIVDLTLGQVRQARIDGDLHVPTLTELLADFPDARFNVDAKSDAAVDLLVRDIHRMEAHDRVCLSSFSPRRLRRLRQLLPGVPTAVSSYGIAKLRFLPGLGRARALDKLLDLPGAAVQLPVSYRLAGREVILVTPKLIAAAHRAGKQVHVWTVDAATEMDRLIDLGVDGIFTDRIDILKAVAIRRGVWS